MIVERPIDCGALYDEERAAFIALLESLPADDLERVVPATPAWSVHDVLAHVVAITADLNAQDFGKADADAEAWTARQVASRRGRTVGELGAEWDAEAPAFTAGLELFGYELSSHFVGDLVQHVADVHAALGLPQRSDDDLALVVALDFYLDALHEALVEAEVGASLDIAGEEWRLGTGPPVATLRTGRFEALRAIGGRRSLHQLRAMAWTGDSEVLLPRISRYGLPTTDLLEG